MKKILFSMPFYVFSTINLYRNLIYCLESQTKLIFIIWGMDCLDKWLYLQHINFVLTIIGKIACCH